MSLAEAKMPPVRYDNFRLEGGLDLVTPTLSLKPGVARAAQNFEISVSGGYSRIPGYERCDGQPAPSAATYSVLTLNTVTGVAVGNTIVNSLATASGHVIAISGLSLVYTKAVGTFTAGQTILVGATTIGTMQAVTTYSQNITTQAVNAAAAADVYRADIQVVPGSGPVRGVERFNGVLYAWRNNSAGTALALYKSSAGGWTAVALGNEMSFTTGVLTAFAEGNTVYGGTSGATGVISRVVLESGSTWIGGTGRLILSSVIGVFVSGEPLKMTNAAGTTRATSASAATAITLLPGGRVQTDRGTFGGTVSTRIYGADGVNRGFEFDGTVYVPIRTGMATDNPTCVSLHKNYLFFSFAESVQNSAIGTPYIWSPIFGANEILMPETVTAMVNLPGTVQSGALAIFSQANTFLLYGTSMATWNLVPFNTGVGSQAYTAQTMENAYALDARGVISMQTSLNYGNFDSSTLTLAIRPFIQARRNIATASGLNREKSQYRVFYSDGYGLYTTIINGQAKGSMPVLFPDPVNCWCDGDPTDGNEISYFGGSLGYVYQMDTGASFDGANIPAYFTLNFASQGGPRMLKRYRRASLEITGAGYAAFYFGYALGYGSTGIDQASAYDSPYFTPFAQATWDSFIWDNFMWDGATLLPSEVECTGTGENIALTITSNSNINQAFTVNSAVLHYSPRRGIR
jgi:hypothetical protein